MISYQWDEVETAVDSATRSEPPEPVFQDVAPRGLRTPATNARRPGGLAPLLARKSGDHCGRSSCHPATHSRALPKRSPEDRRFRSRGSIDVSSPRVPSSEAEIRHRRDGQGPRVAEGRDRCICSRSNEQTRHGSRAHRLRGNRVFAYPLYVDLLLERIEPLA